MGGVRTIFDDVPPRAGSNGGLPAAHLRGRGVEVAVDAIVSRDVPIGRKFRVRAAVEEAA
jgi:hypothetical protein